MAKKPTVRPHHIAIGTVLAIVALLYMFGKDALATLGFQLFP